MIVLMQSNSPHTEYLSRYCFGTWKSTYTKTLEDMVKNNPEYLILMELE